MKYRKIITKVRHGLKPGGWELKSCRVNPALSISEGKKNKKLLKKEGASTNQLLANTVNGDFCSNRLLFLA